MPGMENIQKPNHQSAEHMKSMLTTVSTILIAKGYSLTDLPKTQDDPNLQNICNILKEEIESASKYPEAFFLRILQEISDTYVGPPTPDNSQSE